MVWIDGGLHASEVLGAQQLIETIYQLVARNDAETQRFLATSSSSAVHVNPDGMELVSNWYMREADPKKRIDQRRAAALAEVCRPRQQPRLLHDEPAGEHEHQPACCTASGSRRSSTTTTRPGRPAR